MATFTAVKVFLQHKDRWQLRSRDANDIIQTLLVLWWCGGGGGGGVDICPKIQVRFPCITPQFEYLSWQNLA
jgi:hypothetical protein